MNRLNKKLTLMFSIILLLGTTVMVVSINLSTRSGYRNYIKQTDKNYLKNILPYIRNYYKQNQGFEGLNDAIKPPRPKAGMMPEHDRRNFKIPAFIILDKNRKMVVDTRMQKTPIHQMEKVLKSATVIRVEGEMVGYLLSGSMVNLHLTNEESFFLSRVNWIVITTSILILIISIITIMLVTKRVTKPLRALTQAARSVSSGNYNISVNEVGNDEVTELTKAFNTMVRDIESNEKWRKQLIADSAHELRTPVTLIQGHLELMLEGIYHKNDENLETIYRETKQLSNLIHDLQELSSAESGKLTLHMDQIEIKSLMETVISSFSAELNKRSINLQYENPNSMKFIYGDEKSIRRVLNNIISNAIKYSNNNSRIDIVLSQTGEHIVIEIRDNGPGIPEADLEKIFERFYRTDQSRNSETGGRGLGLAICRELIKLHNGKIYAKKSDSGADIVIQLPLPTV